MEIDPPTSQHEGEQTAIIKDDDFFKAADTGDVSFFMSLSQPQLLHSLTLRNEDARSLLHVSVSSGHAEVVKILSAFDQSVSGINSADEEGWAPLHSAASSGNVEIVKILLDRGADVNLKNDGGHTALHYAASKGWVKVAEILLSSGAKINPKDEVECTPLHRVASTGNSELCELLIVEGADVDVVDRAGPQQLEDEDVDALDRAGQSPIRAGPQQLEDEDENDHILETQPQQQTTQQTGPSEKKKFASRAPPIKWTPGEELALVRAWIDISLDPLVGNPQAKGPFWKRVNECFQRILGKPEDYRNVHQVGTKFKDISKKVSKFIAIYNNVKISISGTSDMDVMEKARYRYREENNGYEFNLVECWKILSQCSKWKPLSPVDSTPRPSKRTKPMESHVRSTTGSSDAHAHLDVNEDGEEFNTFEDEEEEQELQRLIGRNQGKRPTSISIGTGSKEESMTSLLKKMDSINEKNDRFLSYCEEQLELMKADRKQKDYEFYIRPTDHLTGGALTTTLVIKEEIRQKYGWNPL